MGPDWEISDTDIDTTLSFVHEMMGKNYVKKRIRDNIAFPPPEISQLLIWEGMFDCLLSTRQKSGPGSAIAMFLNQNPFPLPYGTCVGQDDPESFIRDTIGSHRSIQYKNKIAQFAAHNLRWLETGGWVKIDQWLLPLQLQRKANPQPNHKISERQASHDFDEAFLGIGPKQARNYLQLLGLTRYEIPIDSRFIKWIVANEFPLLFDGKPVQSLDRKIINQRLSVPYWYDGILDRLQELCNRCDILPVVLDGCVFASFDGEWEEGKIPF
jgi:hypothetical protein